MHFQQLLFAFLLRKNQQETTLKKSPLVDALQNSSFYFDAINLIEKFTAFNFPISCLQAIPLALNNLVFFATIELSMCMIFCKLLVDYSLAIEN